MFVAAQHPNATSPFVHYTSPRLRRDAKGDAQRLVNEFQVLMNGLIHARRRDALELAKTLEKANIQKEEAEAKLRAVQEAMHRQKAELELEIVEYRARLGM
jgi:hypothetical protein